MEDGRRCRRRHCSKGVRPCQRLYFAVAVVINARTARWEFIPWIFHTAVRPVTAVRPCVQSRRLLVRWCAPEVLLRRSFSPASGVWSFAVVAWELLSFGMHPYSEWSDDEVVQGVTSGFVLPMPSVSNKYHMIRYDRKYLACFLQWFSLAGLFWMHQLTLKKPHKETVSHRTASLSDAVDFLSSCLD